MNISVIVPVYNVEPYIERCLRSIMSQTFTDGVECILVNDCTPDKSMEIAERLIEEYKGNIQFRIISHEKNRGIAAVRNTGLDAAQGTYIQYIDSDDYVEPDMLEKMYKDAVKTNADIVVADYWESHEDCEIYQQQKVSQNSFACLPLIADSFLKVALWIKLIKRSLFFAHNLRFLEYRDFLEDWRMTFLLFFYANRVSYVSQAFVHYVKYNHLSYTFSVSLKNLEDSVANLSDIEKVLKREKGWNICKKSLYKRQISLKFQLLKHSKGKKQREWNMLFKDACGKMQGFSQLKMNLYWRIAFIGALWGCLSWFNLFRWVGMRLRHHQYPIYE